MSAGTHAIPRARAMLRALLPELTPEHQAVVNNVLALLHRRPYARSPAARRARSVTPELAAVILATTLSVGSDARGRPVAGERKDE